MLLLVVLAGLDDRVDLAEPVEAEPDVLQHGAVRPTRRASDRPCRRSSGTAPRPASAPRPTPARRRRGRAEEPVVALDEPQHLVGGGAEPGVAGEGADEGVRQVRPDPGGDGVEELAVGVAGDQEQEPEVGVVLAGEGGEGLVEPGTRGRGRRRRHHRWRRAGRLPRLIEASGACQRALACGSPRGRDFVAECLQ